MIQSSLAIEQRIALVYVVTDYRMPFPWGVT